MGKILGIDLGTTNSAMAIVEGGEPRIVENSEGSRTTPSVVGISKNDERLVGVLAKRQAVTNPKSTIFGVKRFVGHKFGDTSVQKDKDIVPYELKKGSDDGVLITLGDKDYRPEEISATILQKLKNDAEEKTGEQITEAVITVPAYFDDAQRKATKDAGKIAGLDVKRIINEPTAAALAYGFNKKKDEKIAVFDFGGGTFDVSVLEVGDDVIEVKATDGNSHMGGRDIDQRIISWIIDEYKKDSGIDISKDPLALQRLDEAAEKAKIELSTASETEINIPFITSDDSGPKHLLLKLTRAQLNELAREFVDKALDIAKKTVSASPFEMDEIDEVILVGGQTRMPLVFEEVKNLFGKEPNKSINPDEVVALGAAIQGGIMQGDVKDVLLLDVIPLSLGIETMGGISTKLIERNTTIPTSKSQIFSTAADNQPSVEIVVTQGEREMAADNKKLGQFVLDGIPPAPRGTPQIEVTFDIDANGILQVKAVDKSTEKEQSIRIEGSTGLSEEEVDNMTAEAEAHAEEDKKKRQLVEAKNTSEQLVYTAEKSLKDHGDAVDESIKTNVQEKIDALKKVREGDDIDAINTASEELNTALSTIGEAVAKAAQEKQAHESAHTQKDGEQSTNDTATEEKTRDAEFDDSNTDDDTHDNSK